MYENVLATSFNAPALPIGACWKNKGRWSLDCHRQGALLCVIEIPRNYTCKRHCLQWVDKWLLLSV